MAGRARHQGSSEVQTWEVKFVLFIFVFPGLNAVPGITRHYGDIYRKEKGKREEKNIGKRVGDGEEAEGLGDVQWRKKAGGKDHIRERSGLMFQSLTALIQDKMCIMMAKCFLKDCSYWRGWQSTEQPLRTEIKPCRGHRQLRLKEQAGWWVQVGGRGRLSPTAKGGSQGIGGHIYHSETEPAAMIFGRTLHGPRKKHTAFLQQF